MFREREVNYMSFERMPNKEGIYNSVRPEGGYSKRRKIAASIVPEGGIGGRSRGGMGRKVVLGGRSGRGEMVRKAMLVMIRRRWRKKKMLLLLLLMVLMRGRGGGVVWMWWLMELVRLGRGRRRRGRRGRRV